MFMLGVIMMLQIKDICKEYKTGALIQKALNKVSLNLRDNEFVAILGPSGSGKTTLLNIIGGLDRYDSGDLIINGISTKNYKDRDWDSYRNHTIGFVFQSYNLIPHQTILSNVELALTISGISKSERKKKAQSALEQVGLGEQIHKKPNQLSGGQMQRVAIARALVNDPDILLADEPTGALDSDTSVQVMDLLKEVAKDRLVVMVTHNPELAEEYATRIVNLKDGIICHDSDPFEIKTKEKATYQNMGKTSMSLLTSLSLSFNNLKTKKGRTILTAFAGSIGIIGIAAILSLSNGVSEYIKTVEEDTLSEYPLQIQSTGFDMTSMIVDNSKEEDTPGDVHVSRMLTTMFSTIGSNDLESLKEYLDSGKSNIKEYTNAIEYTYNVAPQIYSSDLENIRQVNPDTSFSSLGMGAISSSNSMMSSAMSTNIFAQMPSHIGLYTDQYDIKAGRWPQSYNEVVVVLTNKGNVSDFMLYSLGLRDPKELDKMIEQFSKEEEIVTPDIHEAYSYEDIMNVTFKLVNASDYYQYDKDYDVWKDKTSNEQYMKNIVKNGEELKIVGIVQAKEGATGAMLSPGIYYTSDLIDYIIHQASDSQIVKDQLANSHKNVFTGKPFDVKKDNSMDMSKMFSIDEKKIQSAFHFDTSQMNINLSGLNNVMTSLTLPPLDITDIISQLNIKLTQEQTDILIQDLINGYSNYVTTHPEADFRQFDKQFQQYLQSTDVSQQLKEEIEKIILENGEIMITPEQMQTILINLYKNYSDYAKEHHFPDITKFNEYFMDYMQSDEAKIVLRTSLTNLMTSTNLQQQLSTIMQSYMGEVTKTMSIALQKELTSSLQQLSSSMTNAFRFDASAFQDAFKMNMSEQDMSELMMSMMSKEVYTYDTNLIQLGYADFNSPSAVSIYPKDFECKEGVLNILNTYNEEMEKVDEDKVITYTDLVGTLMSSVTDIINVISYVLVAFVAISLIVSSIMIGVITYISVLERKKEIGILRAIGASKRNISNVFNAETFIIGLLAGVLGIVITLLLLIPANQVIHSIAGNNQINASLPPVAGIVLIVLSTILTLVGGIIPSRKAAKEDPVTALRTD